jgi:hypothetical protein
MYNKGMDLCALKLKTAFFEVYHSFLTEVLELELLFLEERKMVLNLGGMLIEISKTQLNERCSQVELEFNLSQEELISLQQKLTFYSYRKGDISFNLIKNNMDELHLVDPDGRIWLFSNHHFHHLISFESQNSSSVRNF